MHSHRQPSRKPTKRTAPRSVARPSSRDAAIPSSSLNGARSFATNRRSSGNAKAVLAVIAGISALIVALVLFILPSPDANDDASPAAPDETTLNRVTFVAVGDNLPEIRIAAYADASAGSVGDGQYDYRPIYQHIKPYIESADLAYIKQETHLGGNDIGPKGYPSFNTTDSMANAVVDTGFDLVASASNHSYDWGYFGAVDHSREVWNAQPVAFTGTASNQAEADTIPVVEKNGITFALLDYTYGVNGYAQADLPPYAVNFIDETRIRADVARAQELADVTLVAMHWGTENLMEADEDQLYYAQLLADLEVDVVLGSHPHVIGPAAWITGQSGYQTLVAYSLGNFVSSHEAPLPSNELEGMLSCTFVKEDGQVRIEDAAFTPLINHTENGAYAVYALKDYTPELAERHAFLGNLEDPIGWFKQTAQEVVGSEIPLIM